MADAALTTHLRFIETGGVAAAYTAARRMAWWDWAAAAGADRHRVVICVHGLSRQARDFDALASVLTAQARVIAVDVAGRGYSDWLANPMDYQVGTYVSDLAVLMAYLRREDPQLQIDWVGTSMGGLVGMALAAQPESGIRRLVLNDVGPVIRWEALARIGAYLGLNLSFASQREAADYLWSISTSFGPHTDEQWMRLCAPMLRERDGRWYLHYDPALAQSVKAMTQVQDPRVAQEAMKASEALLWSLYDRIRARTLVLRGEYSDLLTEDTVRAMAVRGPKARCVTFAGVGHAPTLISDEQRRVIAEFLAEP